MYCFLGGGERTYGGVVGELENELSSLGHELHTISDLSFQAEHDVW